MKSPIGRVCIALPTQEQRKAMMEALEAHPFGFKWCNGGEKPTEYQFWDFYKKETVILFGWKHSKENEICYASVSYYKENGGKLISYEKAMELLKMDNNGTKPKIEKAFASQKVAKIGTNKGQIKDKDIQKIAEQTKGLPVFQVGYTAKKGKIKLVVKQPAWKEGDYYPDWEKLTPFTNKPSNELVKVGDLVVRISENSIVTKGQIYKVKKTYGDNNFDIFGENYFSFRCDNFAPLPTPSTTSKSTKPTLEIIQHKVLKYSDSDTRYTEEGLEFDGKKYTAEEATGYAKKIRREVAIWEGMKF